MLITDNSPEYELDTAGSFSFITGGPEALIDGDPIAYAAAAMCETSKFKITLNGNWISEVEGGITDVYNSFGVKDYREWDALLEKNPDIAIEKMVTSDESDKSMYHTLKAQIKRIIKTTGAGSMKIYLTQGDVNFRVTEDIATVKKYKGNRSPDVKPQRLGEARDYMIREFGAEIADGMEADDALSIDHHKSWNEAMEIAKESGDEGNAFTLEEIAMSKASTVLVTIDKDIKMRPGLFVNPDQDLGIEEIYPMGKLNLIQKSKTKQLKFEGMKGFYAQLLLGDDTDNIPGVYFCGDVKVDTVLAGCETEEELFKAVLTETYEGFLREHVNTLSNEINDRVLVAVENGASGSKSNLTKLKAKFKKFFLANVAYGHKEYYHWKNYELKDDGTVSTILKEGSELITISAVDYMVEVARLVYMITTPPEVGGSHLWMPNPVWVKEVEDQIQEKNQTRLSYGWGSGVS